MKNGNITNWDTVPVCVDPIYAGRILGCSAAVVRWLIAQGKLKARQNCPGGRWFISKEALKEYIYGEQVKGA